MALTGLSGEPTGSLQKLKSHLPPFIVLVHFKRSYMTLGYFFFKKKKLKVVTFKVPGKKIRVPVTLPSSILYLDI